MLPAIILAAGESSRMGTPKAALMTPAGRTFIASIVDAFAAAHIDDVVVVTGRDHNIVVEALGAQKAGAVRFARNPNPARGQLSSVWVGMEVAVRPGTQAILVTLVDVPLILPTTITQVVETWHRTRAPIVRPAIGSRHGHPVLFDRAVFDELRSAPLDRGAKAVVRAHADEVVDVAVADDGCLVDVDTPQDYQSLNGRSLP